MLKSIYIELLDQYEIGSNVSSKYWQELESYYLKRERYYHNLEHLTDLFEKLLDVKSRIQNWNVVLFTLFYHDIIYNASKKNNEEKSAELAVERMTEMKLTLKEIEACQRQILATKTHIKSTDADTNYFTDADLSILGSEWETYENYTRKIRKEYSIYPYFLYKKGRKQAVQHFLNMEAIFKTPEFFQKYEDQAKSNLEKELKILW